MTAPERGGTALRRIFESSLEAGRRLEILLSDERAALRNRNADDLQAIAASKLDCVKTLDRFEDERRRLAAQLGFAADESGMRALFAECVDGSALESLWRELMATAGRCRELNQSNGAISRISQEHIKGVVAVLRGAGGELGRGATYDAQGRDKGEPGQRELARI